MAAINESASAGTSRESEEPDHDALIDTVLGDRYRVERRLSQGGMGVVYRAHHVVLDSALAVKVLRKPQASEDQRRFLQEAKLASLIQHPNTVQIIDFGVLPSGQSYLVMELLRGRTLASAIRQGPMEALRVCQIGIQIARGLQAVHDQGIVHRDMKPDNVFLLSQAGNEDFVKIVDFGIAKSVVAPESMVVHVQAEQLEHADAFAATVAQPAGSELPARPLVQGTSPAPGGVAETTEQAAVAALMETPPAQLPSGAAPVVPLAASAQRSMHTAVGTVLGTPPYMAPEQCRAEPVDSRTDQYALGDQERRLHPLRDADRAVCLS
jgi:serine/threonine protein kinase